MTIHILGTGAVGCQVASVLRSHKNKVTLLLRSPSHLKDFQARKNIINYQLKGKSNLIDGFEANLIGDKTITSPISSLIVATKAHHTLDAVLPMTSRLSSKSTILLLQNGVGVAEELVKKLWPNEQPPTIMVGVNRHAVERTAPYEVCHHSGYEDPDALNIGIFPIPGQQSNSDNELAKTIVGIPDFKAKLLSWQEMRVKILRKLVVNSSINAVASVLMCKNKGVLNPGGIAMMQSVCEEAYSVMKDELPEESVESLMNLVLDTSHEAGENVCSTLQDIRDKRLTEIDYLNGYICKLGKEQNIDTKTNQALVHLIHAREALYSTM
jgi:2-dehydropantoate 2-reductase